MKSWKVTVTMQSGKTMQFYPEQADTATRIGEVCRQNGWTYAAEKVELDKFTPRFRYLERRP